MANIVTRITGTIIGYDPGGDGKHGLTRLVLEEDSVREATTDTLRDTEEVIANIQGQSSLVAIGVDTLTCWSTRASGWRPADLWLRDKYKKVQKSIVSPNGLRGSMALNGMAVLLSLRERRPDLFITETHPKVLFWFLTKREYDYKRSKPLMDETLSCNLHVRIFPHNDHEWDSAISAFAALQSVMGRWKHDLHKEPMTAEGRLVSPCGVTHYLWPE